MTNQPETPTTDSEERESSPNMPIQERGETERAKGPMSPRQDGDDDHERPKGPMSPKQD